MRKLENEELDRLTLEQFQKATKIPVVILLDDIRSMHNVGSVFRTSDAFLVKKIYLCGITAQPPHREIQKTALGATESVEWEYRKDAVDLVKDLKKEGYKIICVEQADEVCQLQDFLPYKDGNYCLVFGHEMYGVKEELVKASDTVLEIPQFGTKHSLNISVSVGIVVWEFFRKLMF